MRNESDGRDPRQQMSADELQRASLRAAPQVARMPRTGDSLGFALGIFAAVALGIVTWLWLSHQRQGAMTPVAPPPVQPAVVAPPPVVTPPRPVAPPPPKPPAEEKPDADAGKQSRGVPMIIDTTGVEAPVAPASPAKAHDAAAAPEAAKGKPGTNTLSADELFAIRVGDDAAPPLQQAVALASPASTVVQGTIIPAVLETALDTDLPGYARAIVSRDVRGFDGTQVLIPRGSRLVGQYRSGIETGQSRAYVIWTRVIRPDGVSVQLGSPALDADGSTGLPGEVNRHFWQRYGASILLSVVGGAVSAIGGSDSSSSSTLVISNSTSSAASQALATDGKIPPTIRIPLGTPIQVFTARDLDFSGY